MNKQEIENIIAILGKMKDLKRSGWIKRQVTNPESDADHSFSVAMLVLLLAPKELNLQRCLELALVHDLPEIYSGDYTPVDDISPAEKRQKEQDAAQRLAKELGTDKIAALFAEYEAKESKESIFVKDICDKSYIILNLKEFNKLDNVITAAWYDDNARAKGHLLPEFSNYAKRCISALPDTKELQEILDYITKERTKHE